MPDSDEPTFEPDTIRFPKVSVEEKGLRNLIEEQLDSCLESVLIGLECEDFADEKRADCAKTLIRILMVYSEGQIGHEMTLRLVHELIDDPEASQRRDWTNPSLWE